MQFLRDAYQSLTSNIIQRCWVKNNCFPLMTNVILNQNISRMSEYACSNDSGVDELADMLSKIMCEEPLARGLGVDDGFNAMNMLELDDDEPTGTDIVDEYSIINSIFDEHGLVSNQVEEILEEDDELTVIIPVKDALQAVHLLTEFVSTCEHTYFSSNERSSIQVNMKLLTHKLTQAASNERAAHS